MGWIVLETRPAPLAKGRPEIEEPLHGIVRRGQREPAPRTQHAGRLIQARGGRPRVLDHLHEADEVKCAGLEGKRFRLRNHHRESLGQYSARAQQADLACHQSRARREQRRQELEIAAVPRPEIEHGAGRLLGQRAQLRGNELG